MSRKYLFVILFLMSIVAPLTASADKFYLQPTNLQPGETVKLEFILENSQEYYGFQAEVTLPSGLKAVKGNNGELEITLSSRADDGSYMLNSNELSGRRLIMGAFSTNHQPFTGYDGVLVNLEVTVSDNFEGGIVEVSNIKFVNSQDKDVEFDSTSTTLGDQPAYTLGDVNGDGDVDISDITALVNYLSGIGTPSFVEAASDVNGDDDTDITDIVALVNRISNNQ